MIYNLNISNLLITTTLTTTPQPATTIVMNIINELKIKKKNKKYIKLNTKEELKKPKSKETTKKKLKIFAEIN